MSPASTVDRKAGPSARLVPPDEQFWQRYSPHHEFPLSTVTSAALHILVIALLLIGGWLLLKLGWTDPASPVPVDAVALGAGNSKAGGGNGAGDDGAAAEAEVDPGDRPPLNPIPLKDVDPS